MKFIKTRKVLTNDEARQKIANLQQSLTVHQDNIAYWKHKIGKPLEAIDIFILNTDKLKSPEDFIDMSMKNVVRICLKIEDYKRFLTEPMRWFIY